jgi:2'-phosphotransferase
MSFLLRHGCEKEGVPIRSDGFVLVSDMLQWLNRKKNTVTQDMVNYVVESNDKQRFEMFNEAGVGYIRAA